MQTPKHSIGMHRSVENVQHSALHPVKRCIEPVEMDASLTGCRYRGRINFLLTSKGNIRRIVLLLMLGCVSMRMLAQSKEDFTQIEGMERYEIVLEPQKNEHNLTVEIMPGKIVSVDCNGYFFLGEFSEGKDKFENLYYEFKNPTMSGTRRGCPPGYPRRMQFVFGHKIVPYNSRNPIVVFVPKSFEVKYSIRYGENRSEIKDALKR